MQFEIEFQDGTGPADVEITLSGALDPVDFRRFTETLNADPRFRAGLIMLVDVTGLDTSDVTSNRLQALSEPVIERDWTYPPRVVAIVAPDPQTLAAARAYRAHLGGSKSNRHIFTTRAEAVAWLEDLQPA